MFLQLSVKLRVAADVHCGGSGIGVVVGPVLVDVTFAAWSVFDDVIAVGFVTNLAEVAAVENLVSIINHIQTCCDETSYFSLTCLI